MADTSSFDCGLLAGAAVAFVVDVWGEAILLVLLESDDTLIGARVFTDLRFS